MAEFSRRCQVPFFRDFVLPPKSCVAYEREEKLPDSIRGRCVEEKERGRRAEEEETEGARKKRKELPSFFLSVSLGGDEKRSSVWDLRNSCSSMDGTREVQSA